VNSLRHWIFAAGTACVVLTARHAIASETVTARKAAFPTCTKTQPSEADTDAARQSHEAALKAFDSVRYDEAIRLWTDAYAHDCTRPKIFLNMAQAYERSGDKRGALAMYELYVERNPSDIPDNLPTRIEGLREAIQKEDDAEAKKHALDAATKEPQPQTAETTKPLGVAPWIIVGAGAAIAVTGAILLPLGLSSAGDASDQCADPAARTGCPQDAIDQGESGELMSQLGQGFVYGGVGVAALGLVLELAANGETPVSPPQKDSAALRFVGGPTAGGAYAGVGGRF
jgi:hypothetical protein